MSRISVAYELVKADDAKRLTVALQASGHEVQTFCRDRYPIADAMSPFLGSVLGDAIVGFVVISNSPEAYVWILHEIGE
jgi:hypothetical protein